jgi:predicted DsbA family dithiol-disulfide isomerase
MTTADEPMIFQIDIVSDVVCPWCIVGYRQLDQAIQKTGLRPLVRWHPFELNPDMAPDGQNLRDHLAEKYGTTAAQSLQARSRLRDLGAGLGFTFNFDDDSRMVNTFLAHQLIEWAEEQGRQMQMKLALFKAHFSDGRDVSNIATLAEIAAEQGLDPIEARAVLDEGRMAWNVRAMQKFWIDKGVRGVPAMIFAGKYLLSGAQGVDTYVTALERCIKEAA